MIAHVVLLLLLSMITSVIQLILDQIVHLSFIAASSH